jgi:hypothetical protein
MVRMEEVAVKQGFLHLQQQQTFVKVGTELGWGRAEHGGGELLEIPRGEGILMPLNPFRIIASTKLDKSSTWEVSFLMGTNLPNPGLKSVFKFLFAEGCLPLG